VRVLTADHEYLIRTPLKELLPQLDAQAFWQVHRGTVVRCPPVPGDVAGSAQALKNTESDRAQVA
jgi:hypothetical protein